MYYVAQKMFLSNSISFARTAAKDIVVVSEHKHILNLLTKF